MKRNRIDNDERAIDSNYHFGFFQNSLGAADRTPQTNQPINQNLPDFLLHFLRLNPLNYNPGIIPEQPWSNALFVVDARKLIYPIQWGWDYEGRPFVCFRLNGKESERGVLTLYRCSDNFWKYCFCDLNCIFSPFEYDDNNSKLGNLLTDSRVLCEQKVSTLQRIFGNPLEISFLASLI